jgi:hypothetical protein
VGRLLALLIGIAFVAPRIASAQPSPVAPTLEPSAESVVETRSATWPLMLDVHALIGVEPHDRGSPVAFGAGAELLWRARIGGFAALLASEGTPIIAPTVNGMQQQGFADRISVPFGMASRPLAAFVVDRGDWQSWWARLVAGIGVQLGVTIEHLRTSDASDTTAGLHAAILVDVPLYGGPKQGGVALRLYARAMFTPSISLDFDTTTQAFRVFEPIASGQLYAGLAYYP